MVSGVKSTIIFNHSNEKSRIEDFSQINRIRTVNVVSIQEKLNILQCTCSSHKPVCIRVAGLDEMLGPFKQNYKIKRWDYSEFPYEWSNKILLVYGASLRLQYPQGDNTADWLHFIK